MFTGRLGALPVTFRVACFRARRSTHVTVFYTFHLAKGVGRATSRLLLSGIAESVENVLHVAWLPDRCMTASHLASVQPNLLSRRCLALFCF